MEQFLFALGMVIVVAVFYDFLRTAIALNGLGLFSSLLARTLWKLAKRIVPVGERRYKVALRGAIGPSILIVLTAFWILVHLAGYTLMFSAGHALIDSQTKEPATIIQTIAFTGSALSTLGASTVQVTNGWWDNLSMVAAVNGMIVLTLSVSFILNVLQTTTAARTFASRYNALMSKKGNLDRIGKLEGAATLGGDLCDIAVKLSASPLPAFFSPHDQSMDFPSAIKQLCAMLDEEGLKTRMDSLSSVDISELSWGVGLLGRGERNDKGETDFEAAMLWAEHHVLDDHRSPLKTEE